MRTPDWLPPAEVVRVADRGDVFVRIHRHADDAAPVVLLLHGWSASADTQWVFTYPDLVQRYTVVAVDHHGHGRGLRTSERFDLAQVADDAASVLEALGWSKAILVGFSMGGPVALHFWKSHPELVEGLVLAGTALEWRDAAWERLRWRFGRFFGPVMRSWWYPRMIGRALTRFTRENPELDPWVPWLTAEILRNDPFTIASAGRVLSHYDARSWATNVAVPTAVVVTSRDRLVAPSKQRALAQAVRAPVFEVAADHLCSLSNPALFNKGIVEAIDDVARRIATAE